VLFFSLFFSLLVGEKKCLHSISTTEEEEEEEEEERRREQRLVGLAAERAVKGHTPPP